MNKINPISIPSENLRVIRNTAKAVQSAPTRIQESLPNYSNYKKNIAIKTPFEIYSQKYIEATHKLEKQAHEFINLLAAGAERTVFSSLMKLTGSTSLAPAFARLKQGSDQDTRVLITQILNENFAKDTLPEDLQAEFSEELIPYLEKSVNSLVNPLTSCGGKNVKAGNDLLVTAHLQQQSQDRVSTLDPEALVLQVEGDALNIGNTNIQSHMQDVAGLIDALGVTYNPSNLGEFEISPKSDSKARKAFTQAYEGKISNVLFNQISKLLDGKETLENQADVFELLANIYEQTEVMGMNEVDQLGRAKVRFAINKLGEDLKAYSIKKGSGGGDEVTTFIHMPKESQKNIEKSLKEISVKTAAIALVVNWFEHGHAKSNYYGRSGFGVSYAADVIDSKLPLDQQKALGEKLELSLTDIKDEIGSRNHGLIRIDFKELRLLIAGTSGDSKVKKKIFDAIVKIDNDYREDESKRVELIEYEKALFEEMNKCLSEDSSFDPSSVELYDPRKAAIEEEIQKILVEESTNIDAKHLTSVNQIETAKQNFINSYGGLLNTITNYVKEDNLKSKIQVKDILIEARDILKDAGIILDYGDTSLKATAQKVNLLNYMEDKYDSALPEAPKVPLIYEAAVNNNANLPKPVAILEDIIEKYGFKEGQQDSKLSAKQTQTLEMLKYFVYTNDPITRTYSTDATFSDVAEAFIDQNHKTLGICIGAENLNGLNKIGSAFANKYLRDVSDLLQNTLEVIGLDKDDFIIAHKSSKFTLIVNNKDSNINESVCEAIARELEAQVNIKNQRNLLEYCSENNINLNDEARSYLIEKAGKIGKAVENMTLGDIPNPKRDEYGLSLPVVFSNIDKDEDAAAQINSLNQKLEWKIKAKREGFNNITQFKNYKIAEELRSVIDAVANGPKPQLTLRTMVYE